MTEHIYLVGVEVDTTVAPGLSDNAARTRTELWLHQRLLLMQDQAGICWWIAEPDRHDRSDRDSAVFVKNGAERHGNRVQALLDEYDEWEARREGAPDSSLAASDDAAVDLLRMLAEALRGEVGA